MPVRCLTATPCTIDTAQTASLRLGQSSYKRFLDLSCNIDKTLFLGNNAPCRYYALFDRISSLNCFKNRSKITQTPLCLSKSLIFGQKRRFHALFCVVFIFCHFCRKSAFLAQKTHFFAHFSVSVAFCKKRRPNAPFLSFYAFLSLFATISSMNRSSENTVEMPVGGGNDITLSKCRSSPAR